MAKLWHLHYNDTSVVKSVNENIIMMDIKWFIIIIIILPHGQKKRIRREGKNQGGGSESHEIVSGSDSHKKKSGSDLIILQPLIVSSRHYIIYWQKIKCFLIFLLYKHNYILKSSVDDVGFWIRVLRLIPDPDPNLSREKKTRIRNSRKTSFKMSFATEQQQELLSTIMIDVVWIIKLLKYVMFFWLFLFYKLCIL